MPLPLALLPALGPLAAKALSAPAGAKVAAGAAVALAGWAAMRRARRADGGAPVAAIPGADAALDATPEGAEAGWRSASSRRAAETSASAAWRGTFRLGAHGPGLAIDAAALGRLRLGLLPARPRADARPDTNARASDFRPFADPTKETAR
ncbi:hypothetical protein SAMN05444336_104382 [Albimonas donghaensis]|uniref:Uncharacterized protein n=1 Tax=Albimonas donghaensis TaxID=356660 RepID=A0A1H3AZV3_9RHOB|nr:hypothetical protein [Albimonas donghaensis]SDX35115.1 hypothetical protein SAMN05444336_104382 [Albimonas donghaensis]